MKRDEIEFKVWDTVTKKMLPYGLWCNFNDPQYHFLQYTGKLDRDNVKIFYGDIVENDTSHEEYCSPAVILRGEYEDMNWCLAFRYDPDHIKPHHQQLERNVNGIIVHEEFPLCVWGQYKVIGNVFENPERLGYTRYAGHLQ